MSPFLREWLDQYSAWIAISGIVLVMVAAHLFVDRFIRTRADAPPGTGDAQHHRAISIEARRIILPLALLIWINGARVILLLLVERLGETSYARDLTTAIAWSHALSSLAALWWLFSRLGNVIGVGLAHLAHRSGSTFDEQLLPELRRAVRRLLPLLSIIVGGPLLTATSPALSTVVQNITTLVLIGALASIALQAVNFGAETILRQHRIDVADNLHARAIHTQVAGLKKVATAVVLVFTLASMLMVFDSVRQLGTSILASAGIAGIVVGLAAQRGLGSLLAGLQVTLTQPIRVDDAVVVEGEFGTIEEITLTYVVVKLWDHRRLVVPVSIFIEKPFQNWTRTSTDLIGMVTLQMDYRVSVDALRAELTQILKASPLWDGRTNVLQVTDAKERLMEIRALMSASNAERTWDLRCDVREKLVRFLREHDPADTASA